MSNYYVSGCADDGDDVSICDDSVAQFWTLYHRNDKGLSEGIIDCMFREDAEAAMRAYEQRDALAAENAALISAFMPKEIPTEATDNFSDTAVLRIDGDEFQSWQWVDNQDEVIRGVLSFFKPETPATDAYLNSVRAEGIEQWVSSREPKWNGTTEDAKRFAAQLRSGEPS